MGSSISVRTNYFPLQLDDKISLFRYDVQFDPEQKNKRKRRRCMEMLLSMAPFSGGGHKATDFSANLISTREYDLADCYTFVYHDADEEPFPAPTPGDSEAMIKGRERRTTRARVVFVKRVTLSELAAYLSSTSPSAHYDKGDAVQALNIVVNQIATTKPGFVTVHGNKFYPTEGPLFDSRDIGGGLLALRGYYSSVRTGPMRSLLNVNVASGAFYRPGPLIELMDTFRLANNTSMSKPRLMQSLSRFLTGLRVSTNHTILRDTHGKPIMERGKPKTIRKVHTLSGLAHTMKKNPPGQNSEEVKFKMEEGDAAGKEITIAQYFEKGKSDLFQSTGDILVANLAAKHTTLR